MPEGPEQYTPPESEFEARKEQLRQRKNLISLVVNRETAYKFHSLYTRIENYLGSSTEHNSPLTIAQLDMALAMSNSPAIEDLLRKIKTEEVTWENFNPDPLRETTALQDMKILDLGCGGAPTFARTARRLGADVYTVDVIPANLFRLWNPAEDKGLLEEQKTSDPREYNIKLQLVEEFEDTKKLEAEKHVEIDLKNPDAIARILQQTGGNFDLVTTANIESGCEYHGREIYPPYNLKKLAMQLLKNGGVFYHPPFGGYEIKVDDGNK